MHGSNFASSGVGSRGYAINISSPPSLFFERAESSVSFENGICGPSGWRYVEKVENEVCQTPHFYTFFFRIYPKNIRISTWLFLLLETRPSRLNFWSNASQTGATERWVSILRVGLCWEWIIRSFESNKEFASPTFANLSPSLLFREDREASYSEFLFLKLLQENANSCFTSMFISWKEIVDEKRVHLVSYPWIHCFFNFYILRLDNVPSRSAYSTRHDQH